MGSGDIEMPAKKKALDKRYFSTRALMSSTHTFEDNSWEAVFRCSPAALSFNALDGRFIAANPSFLKMIGYSLEELLALYAFEVTPIDDRPDCQSHVEMLLNGEKEHFEIEKGMIRVDGTVMTVRLTVSLVRDSSGKPLHLMALTEDITEKRAAEDNLRANEERLRAIINYTTVGVNLISLDGQLIDVNPAFCEMLGYSRDECKTLNIGDIVHPDYMDMTKANLGNLLTGTVPFVKATKKFIKKDQSWIWIEATVSITKDSEGRPENLVAVLQDITQRIETQEGLNRSQEALKAGKEKLRLAEERMRLATEAANMGVWDYNPALDIIEQSTHANEIMGFEPHAILSLNDIIAALHPDDCNRVTELFKHHFAAANELENDGNYQFVTRIIKPNGEVVWLQILGQVFFDGVGSERKAVRAIGALLDVTQPSIIAEELKAARDAAEIANATKSAFLANMSHEIRTPLSSILGFSSLLINHSGHADERRLYLDTVIRNGRVLMHLIDDILDLSKVEAGRLELEKVPVQLSELTEEVMNIFRHKAQEKNLKLHLRHKADVPLLIMSDPTRLRQILINLIGNAVKFTHQGSIELEVSMVPAKSSERGPEIYLAVTDTGIGMTEEQKSRLFQPFTQADNSTTRKFGGTGLGLHLAKRLAVAMQGDLKLIDSRYGKGSCFLFHFALETADPSLSLTAEPGPAIDLNLRGRVILVAEDSPDNQFLVVNLLEAQGATVYAAGNGQEALDLVAKHPIDIILMDIQMPIMDGYEATRILRREGHTIPIVALTAHAMIDERLRSQEAGCNLHLTKPLNPGELFQVIQELEVKVRH
jgi:PAS domain S-box-containing protein